MKHPWLESRGFGVRDAWSVVVTTVALLIYGVLQERVMTRSWGTGNSKELFPHSAFLVLSNRLLTVAVLLAHSSICGHSIIPAAPIKAYCMVSASNMVSTLCQYEALKYVSFVTQTLAKTAKALPVLLWGTVIGRRRYRVEQYINAVLSTAGCSLFVLGGNIASAVATAHSNSNSSWWTYGAGMSLLLTYLAADGWTSTQQEHLFKSYGTTIREQLLYTTAFSTIYSLLATIAGRQLVPAVLFLMRHPSAAVAVLMLSAMSTVIQICISRVLQQHGALVFALMMTSRQCASVLLSSVIFQHVLTPLQWLGIVVVFAALYCQKTGKLVSSSGSSSMKSTGGRLPHVSDAPAMAPLLAKQASQPASYIQRSISNFAVPPFGGKPTVAVSVGGMVQGRSHNSQHHHTLLYDPYPAKAHPQTVSAAAAAGYANSSLIDNASGGGSAGLAAHHYMRALQNVAVHVSVGAHNAKPITPRHAARSASGMANGVAGITGTAAGGGEGRAGNTTSSLPQQQQQQPNSTMLLLPHAGLQSASISQRWSLPALAGFPGLRKLWNEGSGPLLTAPSAPDHRNK